MSPTRRARVVPHNSRAAHAPDSPTARAAPQLEDYLAELESITISFEDGRTLNFVEAAMLIQGSAHIYCKKVDHLYELLYKLGSKDDPKKRKQQREGEEAGVVSGEADAEDREQEEEEFEPLADTLKEVDNIDLPPGGGLLKEGDGVLLRPPTFLMMVGDGNADQLRMHSCIVHPSGALLLPHTDLPPHWLEAFGEARPEDEAAGMFEDVFNRVADRVDDDDDDNDNSGGGFGEQDWEDTATPQRADQMDVEEPAQSADDAFDAARAAPSPNSAAADAEVRGLSTPVAGARGQSERAAAAAAAAAAAPRVVVAPTWDPWAPLDPHDAGSSAPRPFRKGKTYAAGEAAAAAFEKASAAARAEESDKENGQQSGGASAAGAGASVVVGGGGGDVLLQLGLLPAAALTDRKLADRKLPLWSQFEALHALESKRRAALRRQRRQAEAERKHVNDNGPDAPEPDVWIPDAAEAAGGAGAGADGAGGGDGYVPLDSDGFGGGDDDDVAPMGFDEDMEATQVGPDAAASVLPSRPLDEETESTQLPAGAGAGGEALSYEDQCRLHLETCLEASAGYHEDVALHERVNEWRARVAPLLEEENCRDNYDIGVYTSRLLHNFGSGERVVARGKQPRRAADAAADGATATVLPFSEAAQCEEKWEVARMFLAALDLTAKRNIDLVPSGSIDAGDMSLSLHLIDGNKKIDFTSDEAKTLLK